MRPWVKIVAGSIVVVALVVLVIGWFLSAVIVYPGTRPDQSSNPAGIRVWHDPARPVTCWTYWSSAISCLPDSTIEGAR